MIWDVIAKAFARLKPPSLVPSASGFHDRRKQAAQTHHGYDTRARDIADVTAICLHQAGADLGESPKRYDTGGAHVFVSRGGLVMWEHDWDRWVAAANGWNAKSISIEVSGRYYGVEGNERTYWKNPKNPLPPQQLTPAAADALCGVIRWIHTDVASRGGSIRVMVAHRQSSATRPSDPGESNWKAALPVALELGIKTANDTTLDGGKPIPREWDPASPHRY